MEICVGETPPAEELHPPNEEPPAATDRISSLPDDVISYILGFLPLQEAVGTSALSRAWRPLWIYAPYLDFCPPVGVASPGARPDVVDHVLSSHRGFLSGCRLLLDPEDFFRRLGSWVALLAEKRIRSLELHCHRWWDGDLPQAPTTLPPDALAAAAGTLRHLSLRSFCLPKTDPLFGCGANLTSLRLSYMTSLTDDQLSDVLACCPRLVKLSLSNCSSLDSPAICSPGLRQLALSDLRWLKAVRVDAPALATLTVKAVGCCEGGLDFQTPRLKLLRTFLTDGDDVDDEGRELQGCRCTMDVLEHFTNIRDRRSIDPSTSPLSSLLRLALHVNLNDLRQVVVLRFMLITCTALREVTIKNGKESNDREHQLLPYRETEVWRRPDYTQCLMNFCETLRELSLDGYRGKDLEWEFLEFLVSSAVKLRRLHIRCCTECLPMNRANTRTLLSTMKRASADLVITFDQQRVDPS